MRRFGWVAFALIALMLAATGSAQAEKRIALLIGNQRYIAKVGPLNNPRSDVLLVGAALKAVGFTVTEVNDADYRSTDAAIKRHIAAVRREGEGAISFVYYSGHGAADPDTKINYLIPVDVANANDAELWNYSINLNTLVENRRAQARAPRTMSCSTPAATSSTSRDGARRLLAIRGSFRWPTRPACWWHTRPRQAEPPQTEVRAAEPTPRRWPTKS